MAKISETRTPVPECCIMGCFMHLFGGGIRTKASKKEADLAKRIEELTSKVDQLILKGVASNSNSSSEPNSPLPLGLRPSFQSRRSSLSRRGSCLAPEDLKGVEVARYSQIPQFDASILDTYIPRYRRLTQLHFGHIVSNPHAPMAFSEKMGYNMTYNLVPPGNGNALHMHRSVEIFVALDGKWEIAWGMKGENTVVLEPWDFVCVPARVCHSYKNIEEQTAQNIMTILPGKSWITWAPNVVSEARESGADCDDNGMLKKYARLASDTKGLASQAETVPWLHIGPDDMGSNVYRFGDKRLFECAMGEEVPGEPRPFIEMFWKVVEPDDAFKLPRKEGVDLLLVVLDGHAIVKNELGMPMVAGSKLDAIRVPVQALAEADLFVTNPAPMNCTLLITATQMRSQNDAYFHLC